MRKFLHLFGVFVLLGSLFAVPVYGLAISDDKVFVREGEVIDDDYYVAGSEVVIEGTINGDLYAAASRLTVRGTVNGDVIAGASSVEITGTIRDDLRVGASTITLVGAEIGDSVSVAANEMSVDQDSTIGGGFIYGGRTLSLDGTVGRGLVSGADDARLDGAVAKSVHIAATDLTIDQDAVINGDLTYQSDNAATIDGQILGEITHKEGGANFDTEGIFKRFAVGYQLWAFVSASLIGGLLILLFPFIFKRADKLFKKQPGKAFTFGALAILLALPVSILLMFTVFGIPLAITLFVLWLMTIYFSKFFVAYSAGRFTLAKLGRKTSDQKRSTYVALLIGLILFYLLRLLPGVGILVRFLTVVIGTGMILSLYKKPTEQATK